MWDEGFMMWDEGFMTTRALELWQFLLPGICMGRGLCFACGFFAETMMRVNAERGRGSVCSTTTVEAESCGWRDRLKRPEDWRGGSPEPTRIPARRSSSWEWKRQCGCTRKHIAVAHRSNRVHRARKINTRKRVRRHDVRRGCVWRKAGINLSAPRPSRPKAGWRAGLDAT